MRLRTWWLWYLGANVMAFAASMALSLRNYLHERLGRRAFVRDWAPPDLAFSVLPRRSADPGATR